MKGFAHATLLDGPCCSSWPLPCCRVLFSWDWFNVTFIKYIRQWGQITPRKAQCLFFSVVEQEGFYREEMNWKE